MTEPSTEPPRSSVNILQSASNVVVTGGSLIGVQHKYETKEISGQNNSLQPLYARVSSNAILNAGGRADDVRCYPGTREEVIRIIEKWIDGDGDLSRRIFWLSGPAGAGKTAIIQTIAERCIQRNVPMANYFFFRADPSRNHARSVVATLLYQILQFHPTLKQQITTLLDTQPLIFDQSIRNQFKHLIDIPVRTAVDDAVHTKRLVLLIDGLDECSQGAKHAQRDLLHAIHHLSSQQGSPFVVLVASRAEPHLVMAFNEIESSNDSIFLNEDYRPSQDIRLFVAAEFVKIKRNHHLGQPLGAHWPAEASIDEIVEKSSGQFIYAATVARFISSSPASPAHSLDRVRGLRPIVKNSPFAELDAIYTHILSQAEDWDSAKDVIASQFLLPSVVNICGGPPDVHNNPVCTMPTLLAPLGLTPPDIESSLSDLVSVVQYNRLMQVVIFYHASLQDFLRDESRSKSLYIDLEPFKVKLATAHITAMKNFYDVALFCSLFSLIKVATPLLKDALISWRPWQSPTLHSLNKALQWLRFNEYECILALKRLYCDDTLFYQAILRKWLMWFYDLGLHMNPIIHSLPETSKIWDSIQKRHSEANALQPLPKMAFWKRTFSKIRHSTK